MPEPGIGGVKNKAASDSVEPTSRKGVTPEKKGTNRDHLISLGVRTRSTSPGRSTQRCCDGPENQFLASHCWVVLLVERGQRDQKSQPPAKRWKAFRGVVNAGVFCLVVEAVAHGSQMKTNLARR